MNLNVEKPQLLGKVFILALFLVFALQIGSAEANAQTSDTSLDRLVILNLPVYSVIITDPILPDAVNDIYSDEFEQKYLSMSDEEFKTAIQNNLQAAINKRQEGANIIWHKDALQYIEVFAPNEVAEVRQQILKDDLLQSQISSQQPIISEYTPGSDDDTWVIYDVNMGNMKLYAFYQRIKWSWNSTQITSVNTSAYAHIYAPLWSYNGLNQNPPGEYLHNKYSYYKFHEGHFVGTLGYPIVNTYPWHSTVVFTGGGWAHNQGF